MDRDDLISNIETERLNIIRESAKKYKDILIISAVDQLELLENIITGGLETTIEVGDEYKELFEKHGGEVWDMVPSLNSDPIWIESLKNMVQKYA